jgi:hypothetical protein
MIRRLPMRVITGLLAGALASGALADSGSMPDPTLTPGAVRTTNIGEICNEGSTRTLRHWSRERDDFILREYGLPMGAHPQYEIDHLIPLGIGGADNVDLPGICGERFRFYAARPSN